MTKDKLLQVLQKEARIANMRLNSPAHFNDHIERVQYQLSVFGQKNVKYNKKLTVKEMKEQLTLARAVNFGYVNPWKQNTANKKRLKTMRQRYNNFTDSGYKKLNRLFEHQNFKYLLELLPSDEVVEMVLDTNRSEIAIKQKITKMLKNEPDDMLMELEEFLL